MKTVAGALVVAAVLSVATSPATAHGTHPFTKILVVPRTVYIPTYVAPSYGRWVPGYWTYQWIPQVYTYHVWVPAHYSADGFWMEGHYQPQVVQTGYYQQVWVGGYWLP